jgi:hypothetical protein
MAQGSLCGWLSPSFDSEWPYSASVKGEVRPLTEERGKNMSLSRILRGFSSDLQLSAPASPGMKHRRSGGGGRLLDGDFCCFYHRCHVVLGLLRTLLSRFALRFLHPNICPYQFFKYSSLEVNRMWLTFTLLSNVITFTHIPVLARQPLRAADPLLRSSRGGEGDPPLCIGKQEVGPTYIASYTHTLGSWDDSFWSFTAVNVKGTSVTTWADERNLRRCLMQLSDTCFGTTASSSTYGETRP